MPTSPYSQHKSAAERLLDAAQSVEGSTLTVTRMRPGFVLQAAGSGLLRYGLPGYVPAAALAAAASPRPQPAHSGDPRRRRGQAIVRAMRHRIEGAFNLAAEPPLTRDDVAAALGARPVQVPARVLSALVGLTWRARLQALEPGWVDLALSVPQLDSTRARQLLGWAPTVDARTALGDFIAAAREAPTPPDPCCVPGRRGICYAACCASDRSAIAT